MTMPGGARGAAAGQVHDQGYRRYAGSRAPRGGRWRIIASAALRARLRERLFLALLMLSWGPFVVRAVQMYVAANVSQASFLAPTVETFRAFLDQQSLFVFFVTIYAGAGLIADDRRANALQIYLSRPLTRVEYVGGKLAALAACLAAVTWLPAMLLLLLQVAFAGSTTFLQANLWLVPAITAFAAAQVLVSSFAMLALSSLSRSRRFVAIMYAGIIFFTSAMYQTLRDITGSRAWAWISPEDTFDVLGAAIFGSPGETAISLPAALLVVGVMVAASIAVLERRIRAVEIVA